MVAIADYRDLHAGRDPGITNAPRKIASNVHDIRLSPDQASRKDLVFQFRTQDGMLITKPNGQVKAGSGQYITRKLVQMAKSPGYGKVGYLDSRYVNLDGTPRVAPDGFTDAQARRLQEAQVRLRGIKYLDSRSEKLILLEGNFSNFGMISRWLTNRAMWGLEWLAVLLLRLQRQRS